MLAELVAEASRFIPERGWGPPVIKLNADRFISRAEGEMRKIITIAIIVATATITTAWTVSTLRPDGPNRGAQNVGRDATIPTCAVLLVGDQRHHRAYVQPQRP
jgi:hypothetical protein